MKRGHQIKSELFKRKMFANGGMVAPPQGMMPPQAMRPQGMMPPHGMPPKFGPPRTSVGMPPSRALAPQPSGILASSGPLLNQVAQQIGAPLTMADGGMVRGFQDGGSANSAAAAAAEGSFYNPNRFGVRGTNAEELLASVGYTPEKYEALDADQKARVLSTLNTERGLTRAVTTGPAGYISTQPYAAAADVLVAAPVNIAGRAAGIIGRGTGLRDAAAPDPFGFSSNTPYFDRLVRAASEANQPITAEQLQTVSPPGFDTPEDKAALEKLRERTTQ